MNQTKLIVGTFVGSIANFLGGWVIFGMLLMKTMESNMVAGVSKTEPNLLGIFVSGLVYSFLLTFIFERWASIRTLQSGAVAGAIITGLAALSFDIGLFSMANWFTSFSGVVVDVIANTVLGAITGATIGWFLGYNRKD